MLISYISLAWGRVKKINSIFSDICQIRGGGSTKPKMLLRLFLNPDIMSKEGMK